MLLPLGTISSGNPWPTHDGLGCAKSGHGEQKLENGFYISKRRERRRIERVVVNRRRRKRVFTEANEGNGDGPKGPR